MVYLRLDLSRWREVQKRFIEYTETILKNDLKIDELIDWENNKDEICFSPGLSGIAASILRP